MHGDEDNVLKVKKELKKLCNTLFCGFMAIILLSALLVAWSINGKIFENDMPVVPDEIYNQNYDISRLNDSDTSKEIKYGYEIFVNTSNYIGPGGKQPYAGNRLACNNCHLSAGTKPYAAPLIGVVQRFPQFRGRENKMGTIEERINGCMERSMNGRMMPEESIEMKAMVAYLNWLGRYAPEDGKIEGKGFVKLKIPERSVDLAHGKQVFTKHCTPCHQENGQGTLAADGFTYEYPPLWGEGSYNNGAGMTRVITAARFIKGNMPFGTTYDRPTLTDEEAFDVAGFINQQQRPVKPKKEADFPDLIKKPVSTPYGPYADTFPLKQHQLGPFQPIMEYYKNEFNIIKSK